MEINTAVLEEIGFSRGEIKVYFSLLELGETTIGPLAAAAKVTPAKVYLIINKLASKGLASTIIKRDTKFFSGADPQRIIEYLEEKNKKIQDEKKQIRQLIPKLEQRKALAGERQTATVYQSFDGMRTLYNEMIETLKQTGEDFIAFTLGEEEYRFEESMHFFREYDRRRRENGIKLRLIGPEFQRKFFKSLPYDRNISLRFVPFNLPTGVIVFGNKVATMVWSKTPTAFVIESKTVANHYKQFFQEMWKQAKQ